MDLKQLLEEWNVDGSTIQAFLDNKVTLNGLTKLSDQDLKDLVPLIGPRNELKERIAALNNNGDTNRLTLNKDQSDLLMDIVSETEKQNGDHSMKGSENTNPGSSYSGNDDCESNNSESDTLFEKSRSKTSSQMSTSRNSNKTSRLNSSSDSYDLSEVLESAGGTGELILSCYKSKGLLNDSNRSALAKIIISKEIAGDFNKRFTKERASFIAQKITQLFPSEILSTWYRTEQRSNSSFKVVKGRLMRRFYTQRKGLKKLGAIGHTGSDSDEEEENEDRELHSDIDDDSANNEKEALIWLTNRNLSPWTKVLSAWKDTSRKRLKVLQVPVVVEQEETHAKGKGTSKQRQRRPKVKTTNDKVMGYTQKFPQLSEPQGWALFEIDFEHMQVHSIFKLDTTYERLEKFVIQKLQERDSNKLFDDFHLKSQNERSAFIFLSLAELFPVNTVAVYQKKTWRPSRQEMRDSFLLQVNCYGDLNTKLEIRRKKLQQFNVTVQPLAIIIKEKDKDKNTYKSLLKYDNFEFTGLESPLKAIDIVFKSYHALHAYYPAESEVIWQFIQKAIYQFSTKWDKQYDVVDRLVAEFQSFQM